MSLERYFQRAHDEARRLLRKHPWMKTAPPQAPCWLVVVRADQIRRHRIEAPTRDDAAGAILCHYGLRRQHLVCAARICPTGLQRILDDAMFEPGAALIHDGSPTLAAGEGAEARRLLEMAGWDRIPQARWPVVSGIGPLPDRVSGT